MSMPGDTICVKCEQPIKGRMVVALGKSWHPEHFICQSCSLPITGDKFNQKDGQPYCEEDYANLFLKKCTACNRPIKEKIVIAMGKQWHVEHFVCATCGKNLTETSFFERNGVPFCHDDYNNTFAPKCYKCKKPIIDTAIVALDEKWHQDCFKCAKCDKPIKDPTFEVVDDKPICTICSGM